MHYDVFGLSKNGKQTILLFRGSIDDTTISRLDAKKICDIYR